VRPVRLAHLVTMRNQTGHQLRTQSLKLMRRLEPLSLRHLRRWAHQSDLNLTLRHYTQLTPAR